ncbi:hypothetical protein [Desulfovibrio sp. MES5]|uniref:hypothetical protein n=1 Tax=Desulfovibrio sp. MES5 TaxID=1899016 RepID=UPI0025BD65FD|nr:hypothetical protein [Desulfovibrio sp. MES5]
MFFIAVKVRGPAVRPVRLVRLALAGLVLAGRLALAGPGSAAGVAGPCCKPIAGQFVWLPQRAGRLATPIGACPKAVACRVRVALCLAAYVWLL